MLKRIRARGVVRAVVRCAVRDLTAGPEDAQASRPVELESVVAPLEPDLQAGAAAEEVQIG